MENEGIELVGVADTLTDDARKIKWFKEFEIHSLGDYENMIRQGAYVIVAVNACSSLDVIHTYLEKYHFPEEVLLVPNPYTTLRPFVMNDEFAAEERIPVSDPRYKEVGEMFQDQLSKKIYQMIINSGQYDHEWDSYELAAYSQIKDMYWYSEDYWQTYPFKKDQAGEKATVIDCGAYIGDSIEQICGSIPQNDIYYYAFEPFEENALAIKKNERYRQIVKELTVYQYGVGGKDAECTFQLPDSGDLEGGRFIEDGHGQNEQCLQIRRLDSLGLDIKGQLYIKMDIEGSELEALKGAEQLIKKQKPYLAVCLYHRKNDLLDIPAYLAELMPDYKFYLRGGYHTILWAVPNHTNE